MQDELSVPYGTCHCGCGEYTNVPSHTHRARGEVAGEPKRYIAGHNKRSRNPEYVVDENGCWIWQRSVNPVHGYGHYSCTGKPGVAAHRMMYERHVGPIPEGLQLDHLCRVRRCVNPAHLEPVSGAENMRRAPNSKLSHEQVRRVKRLVREGVTQAALAREYGVTHTSINSIVHGRTWKDVA